MTSKPIFFDPTGRRGRVLARLAWALGTISALVAVLFIATLMIVDQPGVERPDPTAPHPSIRCAWEPTCSAAHGLNTTAVDPERLKVAANLAADLRKEERALRTRHPQAEVVDRRPVPASLAPPGDR